MARRWTSASRAEPIVLALFGPTAAGKSALAHAAALALNGEIVVADPFQRYRGLEIASDAPSERERREVRYHCVGDLDLTETSSAGDYARTAHRTIDEIAARGKTPIVAGGTGLYLRAAIADLDFPADPPADVVRAVEALVADDPAAAVQELQDRDPDLAARLDLRNPRRVARALARTRAGITSRRADGLWLDRRRRPTVVVGVTRPIAVLDQLISRRVRRELEDGLVLELTCAGDAPATSRAAAQIIGYHEVTDFRAGRIDESELPDLLARRTRRLARAQLTWMRKMPFDHVMDLGVDGAAERVSELVRVVQSRPQVDDRSGNPPS